MGTNREKLLDKLVKESFRYDPSRPFRLRSGKMSDIYIDAKAVTLTAQGMPLVGEVVWEKIAHLGARAIGGLTLGADPQIKEALSAIPEIMIALASLVK